MDPRVALTLKLIHEKGNSLDFDLDETSKLLGLSPSYLLRLFHREVRKPLTSCLREARMARAAQLLKQTCQPIKVIALDCGYTDTSNFYRDFKIVYTVTPKQLRLRQLVVRALSSTPADSFPPNPLHNPSRQHKISVVFPQFSTSEPIVTIKR